MQLINVLSHLGMLCLILVACTNGKSPVQGRPTPQKGPRMDYNLKAPDYSLKLNKDLREISGLICYKDAFLCAIQDEKGHLYQLPLDDEDVQRKVNFSADGDYEDITLYEELIYVLRADGVLFELSNWKDRMKAQTRVINTNLGEINDTEGLAYDPRTHQLWIACKGSSQIGQNVHQERGVYAYDLASNTFDPKPVFTLSRQQLKDYVKQHLKGEDDYDFYKKLLKKAKSDMPLQPSALGIHPITEDIYLLCAVGNSLVVLNRGFGIKALYRLSEDLFEQPEGLAFDSKGNLYLASEGVKHKARIHFFEYRKDR